MQKQTAYKILKWAILLSAYGFLIFQLIKFDQYEQMWISWKGAIERNILFIIPVLILLPVNWSLEAKKWQFLIKNVQQLSFIESFKSVMIGNTTAFFTPNRLGEFPGRSISLKEGKKLSGITLGVLGSIAQTVTIMLGGIPSTFLFIESHSEAYSVSSSYLLLMILMIGILLLCYFFLPDFGKILANKKIFSRIKFLLEDLSLTSKKQLAGVLILSLLRYLVFCSQFYLLLHFFDVKLDILTGIIAIATNYLFITFTPSLAFSEGAIRTSMAILVIGTFSENTIGIAAAGMSIWLINFVLPMAVGSLFLGKD